MIIASCILMMGIMFIYPDVTAEAARNALTIFGHDIVPTLFPYMVLTRMLNEKLRESEHSSLIHIAIFGLLGGSPSGASMIQSYSSGQPRPCRTVYGLIALTGTISPIFLLNTVSVWLGNTQLTLYLIIAHFTGTLLTFLCVQLYLKNDEAVVSVDRSPTSENKENLISSCAISVISIGGCLVFYSVVSAGITTLLFRSENIGIACLHAVIEISGGLKAISQYIFDFPAEVGVLSAFACGFTGLSLLSQNALFLKKLDVTFLQLFSLAILRAFISSAIMLLFLPFYVS